MRVLYLFLFALLTGCGDGDDKLSPEQVTLNFFNAVYVDRDVSKAKQFVNKPMKELINHYYIASSVQRQLVGVSMTNAKFEILEVDIDFLRKFASDVTILIKMEGMKGSQKWIDDRTITLEKTDGQWLVAKISADYKTN